MIALGSVSLLIEIVIIVVIASPLVIGALFVIVTVATRAEPDVSGRRPLAVYLYATAFITLVATLIASYEIAAKLFGLLGHRTSRAFAVHPVGDAAARGSVIGVLVGLAAGTACVLHLRAASRISAAGDGTPTDPVARIRGSYISAVCFICVVIVVVASVAATYQLFLIAAPGVFNPGANGTRLPPVRALLPYSYLAVTAALILRAHLRLTPAGIRPQFGPRRPTQGPPIEAGPAAPTPISAPAPALSAPSPSASDPGIPTPPRATRKPRAPRTPPPVE